MRKNKLVDTAVVDLFVVDQLAKAKDTDLEARHRELCTLASFIQESSNGCFRVNRYQAYVGALAIHKFKEGEEQTRLVQMPAGSGKTLVQLLIAMKWLDDKKSVWIVTHNAQTKEQTQSYILDWKLSKEIRVLEPCELTKVDESLQPQLMLIDEADDVVNKWSISVLSGKKAFAGLQYYQKPQKIMFTATVSDNDKDVLKSAYGMLDSGFRIHKSEAEISTGVHKKSFTL